MVQNVSGNERSENWTIVSENETKVAQQTELQLAVILALMHRMKWRHKIYGHDTIAILWV